jgi:hypothetical protein
MQAANSLLNVSGTVKNDSSRARGRMRKEKRLRSHHERNSGRTESSPAGGIHLASPLIEANSPRRF